MEDGIRSLEGIRHASVDFVSKKLTVETLGSVDESKLIEKIEKIVKRIEPEVELVFDEKKEKIETLEQKERKAELAKISAGSVLFAAALLLNIPDSAKTVLFLASYVIAGSGVIINALKSIMHGQVFGENFLMTAATIGAILIGQYPEGVAVMLFYLVGEFFQDMAVDRSRRSITSLMGIRPDYANLKIESGIKKVSPDEVKVGDIIIVKPGEKIPLDGVVEKGSALVDTAAITGESTPRKLNPGETALSGFINKNGMLAIKVTKTFGESTVSKILDLVQNAAGKKAPTEQFITKFAKYYTPVVVFGALFLAALPPLFVPGADFGTWVYRALVFLVVSCPCALVISIPLGFFGGIGGASKKGILFKGGNYLEALNNVEAVVFDKTGTLTKGVFKVTRISASGGYSPEKLLELAAYAESFSNHPIAVSILNAYSHNVDRSRIDNYREIAGKGIRINLDGNEVIVGNSRLMEDENISFPDVETAGTVVHVAENGKYAGYMVISDELKEDAEKAVKGLKDMGIEKIIMLTGDLKASAERIGNILGIDEVHSELLPAEKVEKIEVFEKQKAPGAKIVFVGDGINDAPVLARADVGIAMGGLGSDAAIEAADVVIMTDEPSKVIDAIAVANRTRVIVAQNIVFALGVKGIVLLLAAFGMASMWAAVFADTGVALIAVLNSMRALKTK